MCKKCTIFVGMVKLDEYVQKLTNEFLGVISYSNDRRILIHAMHTYMKRAAAVGYDIGRQEFFDKTKKPVLCYDKNGIYIRKYKSISQAAEALGIDDYSIWRVLKGKRHTTKGYIFRYAKEKNK